MSGIAVQTASLLLPSAVGQLPAAPTPPVTVPEPAAPTITIPSRTLTHSYPNALHAVDSSGTLRRCAASIMQDPEPSVPRGTGQVRAVGAYIFDSTTSHRYHVTGTDANGNYIGPHSLDPQDRRTEGFPNPAAVPGIYIRSFDEMSRLLQLEPDASHPGQFRRSGFTGSYRMQFESDGSVSVFYSGGAHESSPNRSMSAQTFHHGVWDTARNSALPTAAHNTAILEARRTNSERATQIGTVLVGLNQAVGHTRSAAPTRTAVRVGRVTTPPVRTRDSHFTRAV